MAIPCAGGGLASEFFEIDSVLRIIEPAICGVAAGLAIFESQPLNARRDKFVVSRWLVLHELPVDDQSVGLFREIESVSEFDFRPGFPLSDFRFPLLDFPPSAAVRGN